MIDQDELMRMAREAGFHLYDMCEVDCGYSVEADDFAALDRFACAILERAAVVAESEPKVWEVSAPQPQERISRKIRALKPQQEKNTP